MIGRPGGARYLDSSLDERDETEFRDAISALLRRPFLTGETEPAELPKIRRHESNLKDWFADYLGYRLVVESGFARLMKLPPPVTGANRHLTTPSGAPFSPLHYTLLSIVLAVLERASEQTTLERLAADVKLRAPEVEGLSLDFDRAPHRRAFVHAVRVLVDLTVLRHLDGDEERFARGEEDGDALYGVDHRRRACLLACPVSPSTADEPSDLTREEYPDTAEGRSRRQRLRIMRMLTEEPVLYLDDLSEGERAYLRLQRPRIADRLRRDCGLALEVRREGVLAVDGSGRTGVGSFPAPGTVPHAALLLAEQFTARARARQETGSAGEPVLTAPVSAAPVSDHEAAVMLSELADEHGRMWRADAREEGGAARLAAEALDLLAAYRLVARRDGGVVPLPAIARFAPAGIAGDSGREVNE